MPRQEKEQIIRVNSSSGKQVTATTYEVSDSGPFRQELIKYVRDRGINSAKQEFNTVLTDWEQKPVKVMLADMLEKRIPVDCEMSYGRILKTATVKLWRDIFGQAVRAVRAGRE